MYIWMMHWAMTMALALAMARHMHITHWYALCVLQYIGNCHNLSHPTHYIEPKHSQNWKMENNNMNTLFNEFHELHFQRRRKTQHTLWMVEQNRERMRNKYETRTPNALFIHWSPFHISNNIIKWNISSLNPISWPKNQRIIAKLIFMVVWDCVERWPQNKNAQFIHFNDFIAFIFAYLQSLTIHQQSIWLAICGLSFFFSFSFCSFRLLLWIFYLSATQPIPTTKLTNFGFVIFNFRHISY